MRRPFLAYGLNAIILTFVRKSVELYRLFVRKSVSFAHLFIKNSVLIRFIQYRQARGCASPFVVISIRLLMDYTLYKGAWVASDVFHEEELSRAACVNLLKTGG